VSTILKYQLELLLVIEFLKFPQKNKKRGSVYLNEDFQQMKIHDQLSVSTNVGQFTKYLIIDKTIKIIYPSIYTETKNLKWWGIID
jgi:hypothetical protein